MKVETADGKTGLLLYIGGNNPYVIRFYDDTGSYKDYSIAHSDLSVKIDDADAYLYDDGINAWIDHAPETLGSSYS